MHGPTLAPAAFAQYGSIATPQRRKGGSLISPIARTPVGGSRITGARLRLHDGRCLGYAEYGDLAGRPVLHCHGTPSSRFDVDRPDLIAVAQAKGVRIIAPDRPGIGLSTYQPRRTLLDWPSDVVELADALGLERFAVLGLSGGAPYAAACAYRLPRRITAAALVSGVAPLDARPVYDPGSRWPRLLYLIAHYMPLLISIVGAGAGSPAGRRARRSLARLGPGVPPSDWAAVSRRDELAAMRRMQRAAWARGPRGLWQDYRILTGAWGFDPAAITTPVHLWHGAADSVCPPGMAFYLHDTIPHSQAHVLPREGHVSLFAQRLAAILDTLAPPALT